MTQVFRSGARGILFILGLVLGSSLFAQTDKTSDKSDSSLLSEPAPRIYGKTLSDTKPSNPLNDFKDTPSLYSIISRIFVVLVIMAALAFVLIKYAKNGKLKLKSLTPLGTENTLIVSETKKLGNKQYLMVVEYNAQKVLIGVSPGSVQHICFLESAFDEVAESGMNETFEEA